jgi:hypothetical protein
MIEIVRELIAAGIDDTEEAARRDSIGDSRPVAEPPVLVGYLLVALVTFCWGVCVGVGLTMFWRR